MNQRIGPDEPQGDSHEASSTPSGSIVPEQGLTRCNLLKGTYSGVQPVTREDYFDTKKFPGKRAWPAEYFYIGSMEAALLGGGGPPDGIYSLAFERAVAKVRAGFNDLVIYNEFPKCQTFPTSNTVAMAYGLKGLFHEPIEKASTTKSSGVINTNLLSTLLEAPNLDTVLARAAWSNQPHPQAEFAAGTGYGPLSNQAVGELNKEQREALPNALGRALFPEPVYIPEHEREIEQAHKEWFS